jgi:hypothetical protein
MVKGAHLAILSVEGSEQVQHPLAMLAWAAMGIIAVATLYGILIHSRLAWPRQDDPAARDPQPRTTVLGPLSGDLPEGYRLVGQIPEAIDVAQIKGLDRLFQGASR